MAATVVLAAMSLLAGCTAAESSRDPLLPFGKQARRNRFASSWKPIRSPRPSRPVCNGLTDRLTLLRRCPQADYWNAAGSGTTANPACSECHVAITAALAVMDTHNIQAEGSAMPQELESWHAAHCPIAPRGFNPMPSSPMGARSSISGRLWATSGLPGPCQSATRHTADIPT